MRELKVNEIKEVNGGCEEHCWGDYSNEGLSSAISAGSVLNPAAGIAFGAAYLVGVMWFDMSYDMSKK